MYIQQYQKVLDFRNSLTDTYHLCHHLLFRKHLIAHCNTNNHVEWALTHSLPRGRLHFKISIGFMNGNKTESLRCMPCPIKTVSLSMRYGWCSKCAIRREPVQVYWEDETSGDPHSPGGVRVGICGTTKQEVVGELYRGNHPWKMEQGGLCSSLGDVGMNAADKGSE